ncbi:transcription antitermination factor NusB [Poriferisphaera sp. WC338]|uniref:transcription antitermination factor NusB n=1 Tax=Poriferisphaera sp. WC338 TaxID=3425129 RepID=UPI003D814FFB
MSKQRTIRRLAMQVLYQIDMTGELDRDEILSTIDDEFDSPEDCQKAVDIALHAWVVHGTSDEQIESLAPDWPTYRQPPVDRAILRLAYYEISSGMTPAKVAINEAVELAKSFASENSPAFINGVLDKLAKKVKKEPATDDEAESLPTPEPSQDSVAWLADAKAEDQN